ncbi:MAG: hypothetical protein ACTSYO_08500 [Candidatus Ranarchaeia archaeon]
MQTSVASIYAAGDVTGIMALETVAAKQGNLAVMNMICGERHSINYGRFPK